jgi:hypothetical protein
MEYIPMNLRDLIPESAGRTKTIPHLKDSITVNVTVTAGTSSSIAELTGQDIPAAAYTVEIWNCDAADNLFYNADGEDADGDSFIILPQEKHCAHGPKTDLDNIRLYADADVTAGIIVKILI